MVCVATSGVIGPYFFEENNQAVTMDCKPCGTMVQIFLANELRKIRQRVRNLRYQQKVVTTNTTRPSATFLRWVFTGYLISRLGDISLPAHSPAFTAPDILWRYLMSKVRHLPRLHPRPKNPQYGGKCNEWRFIAATYAEF
jgi:hypothetical protein